MYRFFSSDKTKYKLSLHLLMLNGGAKPMRFIFGDKFFERIFF